MLKFLNSMKAFVLSLVLLLSVLVGYPNAAQADKVPSSFKFDGSSNAVNVANFYDTTLETQKGVIKSLKSSKSMKKAPGFNSLSILKSEDGSRVVTLAQWQDLASYQAYTTPPVEDTKSSKDDAEKEESTKSSKSKKEKDKKDTVAIAPTKTLVLQIDKTQAVLEGATPAIRGKEAVVELNEFKLKSPDAQSTVLSSVEGMFPSILEKQPAPQSVVLLKSVDNAEIALMANWNCSASFEDLGKPAAFEQPVDIASLADNDQHLYDVVKIISAPPPKADKKKEKSES